MTTTTVTKAEHDRKVEALNKLVAGDGDGYLSLQQAYLDWTPGIDRYAVDVAAAIVREAQGGAPRGVRATESIESGTFGSALADAMQKALLRNYANAGLSDWTKLVSAWGSLTDFRDNKRIRLGGYGQLPTVAQGGPYQPLTTPTDEQETYAPTKRGGTESLTFEAIANDDVRALQQIPVKLGHAAAKTISRFVWALLTANPTLSDGEQLFSVAHANTDASLALNDAALSTGRQRMRSQTELGDVDEPLGITPRFLIVPNELERVAMQLTTALVAIPASGNASDIPNLHRTLDSIVVDRLTDANDWYLVGDPSLHDTIEMGFLGGNRNPELFVQDDPKSGSGFDTDKVTYKIRHIYGGTLLDFRPFYRGQG